MIKLELFPEEKAAFKVKSPLKTSEWVEKYRYVHQGSRPGKWKNRTTPYLVEPMNCFDDPNIRKIILMFAPQTGKTQVGFNILLRAIAEEPTNCMYIMPTEKLAERVTQRRLKPIFENCEPVRMLMTNSKADNKRTYFRFMNGSDVQIAWATSASELASETVEVIIFDETDKYPASIPREGDPIVLGEQRTNAYPYTSKAVYMSTPTTEDGYIAQLMENEADEIRRYWVPCPKCGHYQVMRFDNIKWPEDCRNPRRILRQDLARYECEKCGALWDDFDRNEAVRKGEWRADNPVEKPKAVGFHLPAWYSPFVSLSKVAAEFLKAKDKRERLQTFITQYCAEPWKEEEVETITPHELMVRKENKDFLPIPLDAVVVTAAVDVQDDRLEVLSIAWGEGEEAWPLEHKVIYGDPGFEMVWQDLDYFLEQKYEHESGAYLRISIVGVDSGGHYTQEVYKYCKARETRRVYAFKGSNQRWVPIINKPSRNNFYKAKLFLIGTDTAKSIILHRLQNKDPEQYGYIHFPKWCNTEFFNQLTSEKMVTKKVKGREVKVFQKTRERNEILDLFVMNLAALNILNPNFAVIKERILESVQKKEEEQKKKETKTKKRQAKWVKKWSLGIR